MKKKKKKNNNNVEEQGIEEKERWVRIRQITTLQQTGKCTEEEEEEEDYYFYYYYYYYYYYFDHHISNKQINRMGTGSTAGELEQMNEETT